MSSVAFECFANCPKAGMSPDVNAFLGLLGKEERGLFVELEKALKLNK
jgi:hypothetical protein